MGRTRNLVIGLTAGVGLALVACGSGSTPTDPVKADAAAKFEQLDNTYFTASQAALAKRKTIAPDATQQAINGLVDANHAFAQGLQEIPFPDAAQADAKTLLEATVQVETDAFLLGQPSDSATPSALPADLDKRNAADRHLRTDLGLDPNEAPPAPGA